MHVIYQPQGRALEYSPLACNIYIGCQHGCQYCYAPACLKMSQKKFWEEPRPREGILENIQKDMKWLLHSNQISKGVLFCFSCDPYQPIETHYRLMRDIIPILNKATVPITILTKSKTAEMDFKDLALNIYPQFGMTLTFWDEKDSKKWEPYASTPIERLNTLKRAHDMGIKTWASLEPIIDPAQTLDLINESYRFVDHYKVGKWNHDARASDLNWTDIRYRIENRLIELEKSYYIKKDLREAR